MTDTEIKAIIDKYSLVRKGDKIGTYKTKGIDKAAFIREVGAHKAEIIDYFEAQEKAAAELRENRRETFDAIPGVAKLRKARRQREEWEIEFNRMMETGSSKMRYVEAPTLDELEKMESSYPMAVFALEAEYRAHASEDCELSAIWTATYEALCDGDDPIAVKADHDARNAKYVEKHIWD